MSLFKKNNDEFIEDLVIDEEKLPHIPDGLWFKCEHCENTIYIDDVKANKCCPKCNNYYRMSAYDRIKYISDENSFVELDKGLKAINYLDYPNYEEKLSKLGEELDIEEAVVTGCCLINNIKFAIGVMDSRFIMGSMGSVVGEKITRLFEYSTEQGLPVVIFTASGGARMQEGIISLMQMAKVSMAVKNHSDKGLLYISFLTDPTTGGVTASFAMQGDIILAEPKALVGFAGKRVIEQTTNEKLPDDFQKAEMLIKDGFIDKIVPREEIRETLSNIFKIHNYKPLESEGIL